MRDARYGIAQTEMRRRDALVLTVLRYETVGGDARTEQPLYLAHVAGNVVATRLLVKATLDPRCVGECVQLHARAV